MRITETVRIYIREIRKSDLKLLSVVLSDAEVMKYSFRGICSKADIENYIEDCRTNYKKYGFGQWAVMDKKSSKLIGVCGLNPGFDGDKNIIHLAARFAVAFWGKGYASEALVATLEYSKSNLNLKNIHGLVEPANERSIKAILNNGFVFQKETIYKGRVLRYFVKSL